jgi:hypothetical protein
MNVTKNARESRSEGVVEAAGVALAEWGRRPNSRDRQRRRRRDERSEEWWRRRESNTKLAISRQVFNSLTVRGLWSQFVGVLLLGSVS